MKIRPREPLSEILCQTLGEFLLDLLAIFRTTSAILFVLHYQAPHIPVRKEQCGIDLRNHLLACLLYQFCYLRIEVAKFYYILFHLSIFYKRNILFDMPHSGVNFRGV